MSETSVSVSNSPQPPEHVAIIMDGNGRWAKQRGLPRLMGHKQGAEAVVTAVEFASSQNIKTLTLFAFSTENWRRPVEEVTGLMELLRFYLKQKLKKLHKENVQLQVIGQRQALPQDIQKMIDEAELLTQDNTGLILRIALSYSGRWDITQACKQVAQALETGKLSSDEVTEETIQSYLNTSDDIDLLIRTSGEYRISNFLLWQLAYAEFVFLDEYWPDFDTDKFTHCLDLYQKRQRRFGQTSEQIQQAAAS